MRVCQIQRGWHRCFGAGLVALFTILSSSKLWAGDLSKIETIVIIYAENRSFDHLYGPVSYTHLTLPTILRV